MAKSDYAVKQSLTKEGYEVYNEVLNKLQDSSDKSKLAANENAFIYARMAESWARIRNEYGDTAYTAKDFMAEHAVNMGSVHNEKETYAQPMFDVREAGVDNFKDFILRIETRRKEKKAREQINVYRQEWDYLHRSSNKTCHKEAQRAPINGGTIRGYRRTCKRDKICGDIEQNAFKQIQRNNNISGSRRRFKQLLR